MMASDELIDWDNKVIGLRYVGHHHMTSILIRTAQHLFEEIMFLRLLLVRQIGWIS